MAPKMIRRGIGAAAVRGIEYALSALFRRLVSSFSTPRVQVHVSFVSTPRQLSFDATSRAAECNIIDTHAVGAHDSLCEPRDGCVSGEQLNALFWNGPVILDYGFGTEDPPVLLCLSVLDKFQMSPSRS